MADLVDEIWYAIQSAEVILQGRYDLTFEAMKIRGQRPLFIGDDYTLQFTLKNSAGTVIDLTSCSLKFTAKYKYSDSDGAALLSKTATILTPATNGQFTITIANTDLSSLTSIARGYYDIQLKDGSNKVNTVVWGEIEFSPDVTKTV